MNDNDTKLPPRPSTPVGWSDTDWIKHLTEALARQPAACPRCKGTGEADSGGIMPWGAPAMIPCDCQQPAAVTQSDSTGQEAKP